MTEPQLGTQAMQREGGEWNVTATLTNTGQTENCFALADASCLKSEDPPPPIPILEGPQKCSDDLQLTDWHEVTREMCKEENLNPLAMPVIFSQQAGGPRTWTPIPSHEIKELRKAIKDSGICSPYYKELLKNTLERTRQTLKLILSQVKRVKAQATPQKRLKKAQPCHELQPGSSEQGLHIPHNKPHLLKPNFRDLSSTFIYTVLESSAAEGSYFYKGGQSFLSDNKKQNKTKEPPVCARRGLDWTLGKTSSLKERVVRLPNRLPMEVVESPALQVFKRCVDLSFGDVV
ncbi:hypothetical protein DUI87_15725 [Hirundo rustica rustica]|uniref:Uncharacterized protein n=1 Tax=Hirundo rustica rustica TaxID=333673 RepID=A0A3M0K4T1_HIRRU|nr:hypothetical protein DUI87_15725 [Hirundo rustica rustica]